MRLLLALPALAALAPAALAQSGAPHAVPFGAAGNAVELAVVGPDGAALDGAEVAVVAGPAWAQFHAAETAVAEGVARFAFDAARTAPVGDPGEVVFEVRAGGVVVATHTVRLAVAAPTALALGAPFPNPSRGAATVPYEVPAAGPVRLALIDVLGREVALLAEGPREPGAHVARLPDEALAAGVYVVRLVADGRALVRSIAVVR